MKKLDKNTISELDKIQSKALEKISECEDEVVKKVLRILLDREPTKEDAKQCIRAIEKGVTDRYTLIFNGVRLGDVINEFSKDSVGVRFETYEGLIGLN